MVDSVQCRWKLAAFRITIAFVVVPLSFLPFHGRAAETETAKPGRALYRIYCASCHGETAKGDGATAAYLTVRPADLTTLARRNGGEFPAERLSEIIDGREVVRGHGEREMPLWGLAFQDWNRDTDQEDEVGQRIDQLLSFLKAIQKK